MPPAASPVKTALRLGAGNSDDVTLLTAPLVGGVVSADVVVEPDPNAVFPKKHLGPKKFEDLGIRLGDVASDGLLSWLAASWGASPQSRSGAVLTLDRSSIRTQTVFGASMIAETTFPAIDGSVAAVGDVVMRVVTSVIDAPSPGSGTVTLPHTPRKWRSGSNFRLDIPGLDTVGVARIESFTISRRIDVVRTGASVTLVGRQVQIPNLVVTVGASRAEDWRAWHRQMVITGDQTAERNGALVFMAPDFRSELSRIELRNVGIARLADADDAARVVATLYCEQMQLKFPPSP